MTELSLVSPRVERRLMAVLAADVAGYSRLVGADEEGTLAQWKAHWRELIAPKIAEHRGRIVRIAGDGLLVEFASAVAAVRCAVEIQRAIAGRNTHVPQERRIEFRNRHQCRRHHRRRQRYVGRWRKRGGSAGGAGGA